jgi:hypothetical protein
VSASEDGRDTRFWRGREVEMRAIAARIAAAEPKRITLFIADGYKLLADRAELRKMPKTLSLRGASEDTVHTRNLRPASKIGRA